MRPPSMATDEEAMRHSAAHLLAAAINDLYPGTKFGVGPVIDNGFYYDFDLPKPISEEDLPRIEEKMRQIQAPKLAITRSEKPLPEAQKLLDGQAYKKELVEDLNKEGLTAFSFYTLGEFTDLCKGPHVENTSQIGPFKLLSVAGAYWKGSEKNKMLTRIYGTAFPTQEKLNQHLAMLEEAKKRDHRKLGRDLELFTVPEEVGPGLFIWLPRGTVIKREIEKFEASLQEKLGYRMVATPHIGKKQLWVTSGHWDLYRDKMYSPMQIDEVEYLVKPMNCPMHIMVYKDRPRSYRDLPFRVAEVASVYRYEQSGELSGLARVRYFNQDDAHIFCTADQVKSEILGVLKLIDDLYRAFDLTEVEYWLTLRSEEKKAKYLGDDRVWQLAESALQQALEERGARYIRAKGEAKFYGPSIDIMIKDALGRKWQCGTVQVDFSLPERFQMEYAGPDGQIHRPVMVHRAPLGSLERFISILIEHFGGAFPLWLSPVQVQIIPISDRNHGYAQKVLDQLKSANLRVEIDSRSETMQAKIRDAQLQKLPYMLIVGEREEKENKVAVRTREGKDLGGQGIDQFLDHTKSQIESKA